MRLILSMLMAGAAAAQISAPAAQLTGYAVLSADTFAAGPPSGAFYPNGIRAATPPFPSQPVQGFSSIWPDDDGWFWALADNGYGTRLNSPDFLLRIYRVRPVFEDKRVEIGERFIQLRDPDRQLAFHLVNEGTPERLLTGADLDPESMVRIDDGTFWIGDEFGPFLVHIAADGRVLEPPVEAPGVRSPDNPFIAPADAGQTSPATVARSRGFEGLAWYAPRRTLLALLEGGLVSDEGKTSRAIEFDPRLRKFTGNEWRIPFEQPGNSFTEFVGVMPMMATPDESYWFATIERDGAAGADARFKQVFYVGILDKRLDPRGGQSLTVKKNGLRESQGALVDLLNISDPDHLATATGTFTFPFITTEAVWVLSDRSVVLVNDNNYPGTGGRGPGLKDNTEFIRVKPQ